MSQHHHTDIRNYLAPLRGRTNAHSLNKRKSGAEHKLTSEGSENIDPKRKKWSDKDFSSDKSNDENTYPISSSPSLDLSTDSREDSPVSPTIYTEDNPLWLHEQFDSEPETEDEHWDLCEKYGDMAKEIATTYELARKRVAEKGSEALAEVAHDPTSAVDPVGYLGDVEGANSYF